MSFNFNADEIFQIGVRIETNGQNFYKTVAKNTSDPSEQKLFSDLARWESEPCCCIKFGALIYPVEEVLHLLWKDKTPNSGANNT